MLLSSFISFSPITTIIACNKKDEIIDRDPEIDKTVELFNTIKTKISDTFSDSEKSKIYLDSKDLNMKDENVNKILNPIFKEAQEKSEVFVKNDIILDKINEKIGHIVNDLNNQLKEIPALENNNKTISLSSIETKMNGNDIKTLIDLIDQKQNALCAEINNLNFDYNLQLNLTFKINVQNKEDTYIYNAKSAFITSDKEGLTGKIINLADKLSKKLANQELNGKKIIDNVLNNKFKNYQESFSDELNTILKEKNIKIEKSENMEINREQLSFQLSVSSIVKFAEYIFKEESIVTTIEELFHKEQHQFYQFKNYSIKDGKVFTKNYKNFTLNKWSIGGIELPKRDLTDIKIYHKKNDIENSWRTFYKILRNYFNPNNSYEGNGTYYLRSILIAKDFMSKAEVEKLTWSSLMNKWINKYVKSKLDKRYLLNFDYQFNSKLNFLSRKLSFSVANNPMYFYNMISESYEPKLIFVYDGLLLQVNTNQQFYFYVEK